jgi:hypothetical protein
MSRQSDSYVRHHAALSELDWSPDWSSDGLTKHVNLLDVQIDVVETARFTVGQGENLY